MRLVLASNNAKKLHELRALFSPLALEIVTQGSFGIAEAEEPHVTFIENALAKARHAAAQARAAAIADDSGLCVDALGGAPGVMSARYAQGLDDVQLSATDREQFRAHQDAANNQLLLERMRGVQDRRARFVSVLVAVRSADDPEPLVAFGRWQGEILAAPQGEGGFGYDPLMYIAPLAQTVAQLPAEVKNRHSHRAMAAQQMLGLMREVWHLG
jgi:XTP/dITP diphosphohydrolase